MSRLQCFTVEMTQARINSDVQGFFGVLKLRLAQSAAAQSRFKDRVDSTAGLQGASLPAEAMAEASEKRCSLGSRS